VTIYNVATPDYGVEVGLAWFVPAILLAAGYFFYTYRSFRVRSAFDQEASSYGRNRKHPEKALVGYQAQLIVSPARLRIISASR
jgi:hypothetical protein